MRLPWRRPLAPPHAPLDATEPAAAAGWTDHETHVRVSQPAGFLVQVEVHARVDLPPADVYEILTSPYNFRVFKSIASIPYRRVVAAGRHTQTVDVDHAARWRLGPVGGTLTTRLTVREDASARRVAFRLRSPGFMKAFDGEWGVRPFSQAAVDDLFGRKPSWGLAVGAALDGAWGALTGGGSAAARSSLVTLTQRIQPAAVPPPPVDRIVAKVAARQVRTLLDDLRAEATRRAAGMPSALEEGGGRGGGGKGGGRRGPPMLW
jgi:hypothetical protein